MRPQRRRKSRLSCEEAGRILDSYRDVRECIVAAVAATEQLAQLALVMLLNKAFYAEVERHVPDLVASLNNDIVARVFLLRFRRDWQGWIACCPSSVLAASLGGHAPAPRSSSALLFQHAGLRALRSGDEPVRTQPVYLETNAADVPAGYTANPTKLEADTGLTVGSVRSMLARCEPEIDRIEARLAHAVGAGQAKALHMFQQRHLPWFVAYNVPERTENETVMQRLKNDALRLQLDRHTWFAAAHLRARVGLRGGVRAQMQQLLLVTSSLPPAPGTLPA